jgi:hypothetical protein
MNRNLIPRFFLISLLFLSFVVLPSACSSSDDSIEANPDPVVDPTNANTTIEANTPESSGASLTSTITVQLANSDGSLLTMSGGTVVLSTTGSAELSPVTDNGDGTYSATITSALEETVRVSGTLNGAAITDTKIINFIFNASNPAQEVAQSTVPAGPSILRINSGGPEVTYGDVTFLADQYFVGLTKAYTNPFVTEIAETDMDDIYVTERVTEDEHPFEPLSYVIPVTNGTYTVKFYFAEIYWGVDNPDNFVGGVGSRIFSMAMEGTQIFTDYDLYKELGVAVASTRMYDVEVTDGELNITFVSTEDRPKVSAFEVFGTGTIGL